jgi:hypothetical protein
MDLDFLTLSAHIWVGDMNNYFYSYRALMYSVNDHFLTVVHALYSL